MSNPMPDNTQSKQNTPDLPELKPCPFCRGEAKVINRSDLNIDNFREIFVICGGCGTKSATFHMHSDDQSGYTAEAKKRWNTRAAEAVGAPLPAVEGELEALKLAYPEGHKDLCLCNTCMKVFNVNEHINSLVQRGLLKTHNGKIPLVRASQEIKRKPLKILFDNEWLRKGIENDPDDECCEARAPEGWLEKQLQGAKEDVAAWPQWMKDSATNNRENSEAVPFAWAREWEGDDSDLGKFIIEAGEEKPDDNPNWFPLYESAPQMGEGLRNLSDFASKVSELVWGGELGWTRTPDGLTNLFNALKQEWRNKSALRVGVDAKEVGRVNPDPQVRPNMDSIDLETALNYWGSMYYKDGCEFAQEILLKWSSDLTLKSDNGNDKLER